MQVAVSEDHPVKKWDEVEFSFIFLYHRYTFA